MICFVIRKSTEIRLQCLPVCVWSYTQSSHITNIKTPVDKSVFFFLVFAFNTYHTYTFTCTYRPLNTQKKSLFLLFLLNKLCIYNMIVLSRFRPLTVLATDTVAVILSFCTFCFYVSFSICFISI